MVDKAISLCTILRRESEAKNPAHFQVRLHTGDQHDEHADDHAPEGHDGQGNAVERCQAEAQRDPMTGIERGEQEGCPEQDHNADPPENAIQASAVTGRGDPTSLPTNVAPVVLSSLACV